MVFIVSTNLSKSGQALSLKIGATVVTNWGRIITNRGSYYKSVHNITEYYISPSIISFVCFKTASKIFISYFYLFHYKHRYIFIHEKANTGSNFGCIGSNLVPSENLKPKLDLLYANI